MGFITDFKENVKSEVSDVKKSVKVAQLKSDLRELERQETAAFAVIGRAAVTLDGAGKFGADGEKLTEIQEKIRNKKSEIMNMEEQKDAA